jgi:hypothetical protein
MFSELRDQISLLFFRLWPTAEGSITAVDLGYGRGLNVVIVYEFSVGDDGLYTGECRSPSWFGADVPSINKKLAVGQTVAVRYRRDRPSVNKLDPGVWRDLEDGL